MAELLLVTITRSADFLYISNQDYVDGVHYRGDLIDWPDLEKSLPKDLCGIIEAAPITLYLTNVDNGIDDTWTEIFAAEELRGCEVVIYSDDFGYYAGVVSGYGLDGLKAYITIKERVSELDELLPKGIVTATTFTTTALDLGAPIPLCYGKVKNVPLANVQNYKPATAVTTGTTTDKLVDSAASFTDADVGRYAFNVTQGTYAKVTAKDSATQLTVDSDIFTNTGDTYGIRCFDYLIGYGTIDSIWDDEANGRGIKRNGAYVDSAEYTFDDGTGSTHGYAGYATIRFPFEQVDYSGQPYALTGDIYGIEVSGAVNENYALVLKDIINNETYGLGLTVDTTSFDDAATARATASWACAMPIYDQRKARDIINDLLFACQAYLYKESGNPLTSTPSWYITTLSTAASAETFGENDGYYNNCDVSAVDTLSSDDAIKTAYVEYGNQNSQKFEVSKACHAGFGRDERFTVDSTNTLATAKKIISYVYGMATYGEKSLTIRTSINDVSVGEVVTIYASKYGLSAAAYRVHRKVIKRSETIYDCVSYNASIFADAAGITEPTSSTEGVNSLSVRTIADAVMVSYGATVNAIGSIGGGTQDIDLSLSTIHTGTVDTAETTFTFSNVSSLADGNAFVLILINGGSQTVNWPATVNWAGGSAPSLTASGVDWLQFITADGGANWHGTAISLDSK